jgi:3-oxoacyl-[acyl-carrier protein] reductase
MIEYPIALTPAANARVVIAGGCGGIGRELVSAALAAKLDVTVLDLAVSIERHPPMSNVTTIACDAANETSVRAAFDAISARGPIRGCVNLCGFRLATLPVTATPVEVWDEGINGNLRAAYLLSRFAMPLLTRGECASLVHVTSGLGSYGGTGYGPYAVAKGGMNTLVRALARENAPAVRVNAVAPGYVDTAFSRGGTGRSTENEPLAFDTNAYVKTVPLGRVAMPSDIVGPILFLLGPASRFITGQILHVNGGAYVPG